jgi:hypothetical protein
MIYLHKEHGIMWMHLGNDWYRLINRGRWDGWKIEDVGKTQRLNGDWDADEWDKITYLKLCYDNGS